MSHFPLVLATAVVLFSSFFPTYFHHLLSPPSSLQTLCSPSCPCMCVCVVCADPWKVGSSNHKPERSTFSLRWNERNEHFWMKWSRTLHSNPNFFFSFPSSLSLPPLFLHGLWATILTVEGSLVTSIVSEDRFLTLSASVPFWHQGLPLKLFIAHHVAYISLRCSCVEML